MEERSPVTLVLTYNNSDICFSKGSCNSLKVENNIINRICNGNSFRKSLKRKTIEDEEMSYVPLSSPAVLNSKKPRMIYHGRSFPITRLLEHLDCCTLRSIIETLVDRHPTLFSEVVGLSSLPDLFSVISLLNGMEEQVRCSFPYGGDIRGEYAYNRIRPVLQKFMDALVEYMIIFSPPYQKSRNLTLTFLDHISSMLHRLPEWNNPVHNYYKEELYDSVSNAWISVISSMSKEGFDGINGNEWIAKLIKHNETSGGRFKRVIDTARNELACFFIEKDLNVSFSNNNRLGFDFASCY
ncbi:hypothetical protein PNEG_02156 [Pneumocystis murina B123]|uniref:Tethering factor for nuclear proteasome STS1 n=1 Tax=Pneumocystis murina (strain B123) TaxID=1069680 RepID=M7P6Q8_PNEMU|nr:hypothetical protein PNEG_02156 [Pneumocystis murina B123]EMR09570.1 hypothetical protein PNEG_02156 [Pneumocystis murina B123]